MEPPQIALRNPDRPLLTAGESIKSAPLLPNPEQQRCQQARLKGRTELIAAFGKYRLRVHVGDCVRKKCPTPSLDTLCHRLAFGSGDDEAGKLSRGKEDCVKKI